MTGCQSTAKATDGEVGDRYVTGDGVEHATRDAAFAHADRVAATTGAIIAIETTS